MKPVIIVGGGLAGLVCANLLVEQGFEACVIERKNYPFHRVCGEYISNETVPFLKHHGLFPGKFNPPQISRFQLTSINGKSAITPLDLGGFGISRYAFDHFLFEKAQAAGVEFLLNTEVTQIKFEEGFKVQTATATYDADLVVGSFGKRSLLDVSLRRKFIKHRSPYAGVKYHVRIDQPGDLIALHNFKDGYCGISQVEEGKFTICYLTHRNNLRQYGSIPDMEREVMFRNPFIKSIFQNAEFLFTRPEVINEISFATKAPVEDHVLMAGDAAGMITPLCGNGMAMAIHSAKILSDLITLYLKSKITRKQLEREYTQQWKARFANRLWAGRQIQRLFGSEWMSNWAVNLVRQSPTLAGIIIRNTHGHPF